MLQQKVKSDISYEIKVALFVMLMILNAFAEPLAVIASLGLLAKWQWFGGPTVLTTVIYCALFTFLAAREKSRARMLSIMAVMIVVAAVNSKVIV